MTELVDISISGLKNTDTPNFDSGLLGGVSHKISVTLNHKPQLLNPNLQTLKPLNPRFLPKNPHNQQQKMINSQSKMIKQKLKILDTQ